MPTEPLQPADHGLLFALYSGKGQLYQDAGSPEPVECDAFQTMTGSVVRLTKSFERSTRR